MSKVVKKIILIVWKMLFSYPSIRSPVVSIFDKTASYPKKGFLTTNMTSSQSLYTVMGTRTVSSHEGLRSDLGKILLALKKKKFSPKSIPPDDVRIIPSC